MTQIELISRAIQLAIENVKSRQGGPFGALVARKGEIIAEGTNLVTSTSDPTAHAEIVAIRKACRKLANFQLSGCEIYASCEPCPMCLGAIYWSRPDRVYMAATRSDAATAGFDDEFIYSELVQPPIGRRIPMMELHHPRSRVPFEEWMRQEQRISY